MKLQRLRRGAGQDRAGPPTRVSFNTKAFNILRNVLSGFGAFRKRVGKLRSPICRDRGIRPRSQPGRRSSGIETDSTKPIWRSSSCCRRATGVFGGTPARAGQPPTAAAALDGLRTRRWAEVCAGCREQVFAGRSIAHFLSIAERASSQLDGACTFSHQYSEDGTLSRCL